jgi:hypothetical protein
LATVRVYATIPLFPLTRTDGHTVVRIVSFTLRNNLSDHMDTVGLPYSDYSALAWPSLPSPQRLRHQEGCREGSALRHGLPERFYEAVG